MTPALPQQERESDTPVLTESEAHLAWRRKRDERIDSGKKFDHDADSPCYLCGEITSCFAGNPSRWPVHLHYNGNGRNTHWHHGCVSTLIGQAAGAVELPAGRRETGNMASQSGVSERRTVTTASGAPALAATKAVEGMPEEPEWVTVTRSGEYPLLRQCQEDYDLLRQFAEGACRERDEALARAVGAEQDRDAVRELLSIHNLGGMTDYTDGPMKRALAAEKRLREVERERNAERMKFADILVDERSARVAAESKLAALPSGGRDATLIHNPPPPGADAQLLVTPTYKKSEYDALEQNDRRYRWLQANRGCGNERVPTDEGCYLQLSPRDMDAAIDAALADAAGGGK